MEPDRRAESLAGCLLRLHGEGFSGRVVLVRGALRHGFRLAGGRPVLAEPARPRDRLAPRLREQDRIDARDAARLEDRVAEGEPEAAALAGLRRLRPREVLAAVHEQLRTCLREALAGDEGRVEIIPEDPPAAGGGEAKAERSAAAAAGLDPLPIVCQAVAAHWRPHQVLTALGERATAFPVAGEAARALRPRLPDDPAIDALLERLDGRVSAFAAVRAGLPPPALAALFALHVMDAVEWLAEPASGAPGPRAEAAEASAGAAAPLADAIEIEVAGAEPGEPAAAEARPSRAAPADEAEADARHAALREEVLGLHERLDGISYYELLGVAPDAEPGAIRRAYLGLAKRLHPDALARLGLGELKEAANAIFAQVSRAQRVLGDPAERQRYDEALRGHESVDAERVAQAEALFRRGEILTRAGNFRGALEFLEAAASLWPEEADYQGTLGFCLYKKTPPEVERAREHLERAVTLAPRAPVWLFRLHLVLRELGERERAGETLRQARALDPDVG